MKEAVFCCGKGWYKETPHWCALPTSLPTPKAVQVVRELRTEQDRGRVQVRDAAGWLNRLDV